MKHPNFIYALIALLASSIFVSCQKEDTPVVNPNEPEATKYYVFSYDTFDNDDDVQIISADTTTISISKDYMRAMGYQINASEETPVPITIWKAINTAPFIRNVISTEDDGDRVILTTKPGDLGDVLGDTELVLDTKIYVDHSQPQAMTRSGKLVDNYNRYTDADGVVHPAIIILDEEGNCNDTLPAGATVPTRGGKIYYTPEDIERSNATFGIINQKWNFGEFSITSPEPEEALTIGIEESNMSVTSNLRVNLSTRWFSLDRFECVVYGDLDFETTASIEARAKFKGLDEEEELAKFNCFTAVFWVGVLPVSISCNAGLQFVAEASISASAKLSATYASHTDYELGVLYNNDKWHSVYNANTTSGWTDYGIEIEKVSAEAVVGLEVFADLKLYECAGPKITFGPHIAADLSASRELVNDTVNLATSASMYLGGEYGVEMKILKWKLAAWQHEYTICEQELWDYDISLPSSLLNPFPFGNKRY